MNSNYEIHKIQNLNHENPDQLIQFRHFDHNNLIEFTDKLKILQDSEFYIIVVVGELSAIIHDDCISIKPFEVVMVKPGYKAGFKFYQNDREIEFYTITTPSTHKVININTRFHIIEPFNFEDTRELKRQWGVRIPYKTEEFQNKWLFGYGDVPVKSEHMSWDSVVFTNENESRKLFPNEYFHSHSDSYEYYLSLQGKDILVVDNKLISVSEGELLVIPPNSCHIRVNFDYPFDGFVFRVPLNSANDKIVCKKIEVELTEDHIGDEKDIIILNSGDIVVPQNRETHYLDWTYCEKNGKYGWIPDKYLEPQVDGNLEMNNYYSSYELECNEGDVVHILIEESGWYLVKSISGRVGWIPVEKTNLVDVAS